MPGGNKNIRPEDCTNGLDKNPQNINRKGRPPKIYTILKAQGYNIGDIRTAFHELAFYKIAELEKLHKDINKPAIARIIANQFWQALENNDWTKIKDILEHIIGKPKQEINVPQLNNFDNINVNISKSNPE